MENIKTLTSLIEKAVSSAHNTIPPELNQRILQLVLSRVDMPKHALAAISKRLVMKNKKLLINAFSLLQFLSYNCQLSLYSQIASKQLLFKITAILTNKDIDQSVKDKILKVVYCWEQLFRPHEDLLPLFFQFYDNFQRQKICLPEHYVSPFNLKKEGKKDKEKEANCELKQSILQKTREKVLLANEIAKKLNNDKNKNNDLLIKITSIIQSSKAQVAKVINGNLNENIIDLALTLNRDIRSISKKCQNIQKQQKAKSLNQSEEFSDFSKQQKCKKKKSKIDKEVKILEIQSEIKKKESSILDFDFQPEISQDKKKSFSLLEQPVTQSSKIPEINQNEKNQDLLGLQMSEKETPSIKGVTLNLDQKPGNCEGFVDQKFNMIEKLVDLMDYQGFASK